MKKKIIILMFFLIIYKDLCGQKIFNATKSGTWYPSNKIELNKLLQDLMVQAKNEFEMETDSTKIRAIVVPHAGYTYSGKIAAAVYNLIKSKKIDQIIILGPSHLVSFNGINLPLFQKYKTPLGVLHMNASAITQLKSKPLVFFDNDPFKLEHSIEMQLPFIQVSAQKTKIVPIIVGQMSEEEIKKVSICLKPIITNKTLVIVSSDFTHYGESFNYTPFKKDILLNIKQLDSKVLHTIQHQNLKDFSNIIKETNDTVCGSNPLRLLLELIDQNTFGAVNTRLVAYGTSFDVSKDEKNIVSYASLIITNELDNNRLNKFEQTSLLDYSRNILEQSFKKTIDLNLLEPIKTLLLEKPQGVFSTLWLIGSKGRKDLRGCIGRIYSEKPLYETLAETILDSAFRDSRFLPLKEEELSNSIIEISVLGKPRSVKSYKDIILNKHGIILTNNSKSALFLPNVPQEFGFNLVQTLQALSEKAGLDKNAWKLSSTKFQVFDSQNFLEPDTSLSGLGFI